MKTEKQLHWTFGLEMVDMCLECGKPAAGHHHLSDDAEAIVKKLARAQKPEPRVEHFTLKALAVHSGLSVRKLRALIAATTDAIPHHRIGGRVMVKRADFDQWAAQHRRVGQDIEERIAKMATKEKTRGRRKPPASRAR